MNELESPIKQFQFDGSGLDLLFLTLKNIFLSLITLGIYIPFAKTENRKFLWNNTKFDDNYFAYTGKGMELLKGYAIAFSFMVGGNFVITITAKIAPILALILLPIYFGIIFYMIPGIIYGSHRYKLTRTKLRGINFNASQNGKSEFRWAFYRGLFLSFITLGIYYPWFNNNLLKIRWKHSSYGNLKFDYRGEGKAMFVLYLKLVVFCALTFGLYVFWGLAKISRYKASNLYLGNNQFDLKLTGTDTFVLYLQATVITIFTLGIGAPWALIYSLSYVLKKTALHGDINYSAVEQAVDYVKGDVVNEGFGDALDFDFGI